MRNTNTAHQGWAQTRKTTELDSAYDAIRASGILALDPVDSLPVVNIPARAETRETVLQAIVTEGGRAGVAPSDAIKAMHRLGYNVKRGKSRTRLLVRAGITSTGKGRGSRWVVQ